ncbi:MAG: ABC transporter ATP-binding protein [Candidatus Heimdallarchaeota archaeon]
MPRPLLEIKNLQTFFLLPSGDMVRAVDNVSLQLGHGEALGLVGESGCGKSTLGFSIIRLVPDPGKIVSGKILLDGENLLEKSEEDMRKIRGTRIAMIFQDPLTSLNPVMRVDKHLLETILSHEEIQEAVALDRTKKILETLGIAEERLTDYPHQFSGGMKQRIMIALALVLNPDLIIADEPTTALDVIVQAHILDLLRDLKDQLNLSFILITHDLSVVAELTDRIAVMYAGKIAEEADATTLYGEPLHPYTQGLLTSIPNILAKSMDLQSIPGTPPDLVNPPSGCRFHPRCPRAMEVCSKKVPEPIQVNSHHIVHCWLYVDSWGSSS